MAFSFAIQILKLKNQTSNCFTFTTLDLVRGQRDGQRVRGWTVNNTRQNDDKIYTSSFQNLLITFRFSIPHNKQLSQKFVDLD